MAEKAFAWIKVEFTMEQLKSFKSLVASLEGGAVECSAFDWGEEDG